MAVGGFLLEVCYWGCILPLTPRHLSKDLWGHVVALAEAADEV